MKFDIVTPSFNQAEYLRETIESVLSQEVSGVEVSYYVMDGGSTDGSPELIRSYESRLAYWRSANDAGQSAAIAEGLSMGDGEVVAWINSDDYYPAGAFRRVAEFFTANPEVEAVYGDCLMVNEQSEPVGLGTHIPVSWEDLFETPYLINQESTFVRRSLYEKAGGVDPSFWGAMDYDLWLREFREGNPVYLQEILGVHRFLKDQKSSSSDRYSEEMKMAREMFAERHALPIPVWPFSIEGRQRIINKWEQHWEPILKWIKNGCPESEFRGAVSDIWQRYSKSGVLAVKGTTSFGWVGPEAVYLLDRQVVGPNIDWIFGSPFPGLSADQLSLDMDGRCRQIELNREISTTFNLSDGRRFSVLSISANKEFIPALENMGPAYFSLSLVSSPRPMGESILSVQSMPNIPPVEYFDKKRNIKTLMTLKQQADTCVVSDKKASVIHPSAIKKTLRVAFFTSYPASVGSGCERLIYDTARALIARGHDARVYVMNSYLDENPPFFARPLPTLPMERRVEKFISRLSGFNDIAFPSTALLCLRDWIRSADIWHFHNLHAHYLSIPLLGIVSWTKPVVISPVDQFLSTGYCPYTLGCERYMNGCGSCPRISDIYPGISRDATHFLWQVKRIFFRFSGVNMFFHTQALAAHYQQAFARNGPGRVLHYGIDIYCNRQMPRAECAGNFGVSRSSRFVIGLVHSHITDARKGILPVIGALSGLAMQFPDTFELLVVGHGSHAVKELVHPALPVTTLPFLRQPRELAYALNLCDVLLYPTQAENLSLTCLSALACGVPVITYDAGGQKEAVFNGINGYVVALNDIEGMMTALLKIAEDPALRQKLANGARHTAEEFFDFDRYIDELLLYYYERI